MIRCQSSAWLLCAITLLSSTWTASAQEWTRFRGPNGSGESEARSVPAKWTDKQVNFNVEVPGIGHSSPVLWGDKLFILSANPDDATRHTLCFDAKTGKELWEFQTGSGIVAPPVTWEDNGEQFVAVVSGWGGAVPLWGGEVAKRVNFLEQGGSVWVFKLHKN